MTLKIKSGASVDAILLTIVKFFTIVIGLLTVRIISIHFSYSDYGTYNQAILIASSVSSITILGFTDAANYYFNKFSSQRDAQLEYISNIIIFQIILGILAFIILFWGHRLLSNLMDNNELSGVIKWIAFTPLLSNIIAIQQILFISIGKSRIIAVRNVLISLLKLLAVLISVYLTNSIVTILALILLFDIFQALYFAISLHKYGIIISLRVFSFKTLRCILSYSIPITIFLITNVLMRDTDKYIVSILSNPETFAIYSNASRILPFSIIVDSFTTVLIPFITRYLHNQKYENLIDTYRNYLNLSFVIIWILVTGALLCSSDLIELLYGNKYSIGLPIFIVYMVVSLVKFANFSLIFSCAGETKIILKISAISLSINIILSLILFYFWGPIGCAIATLIISVFTVFCYFIKTKEILKVSPLGLIEVRDMFYLILQSLFWACLVFVLQKMFDDISYLVRLMITYGIYVIALLFINRSKLKRYILALNN